MKRSLLILLLLVALGAGAYVYINEKMFFLEAPPVTTTQKALSKTAKPVAPEIEKPALSQLYALFPSGPMAWIHLKDLGKVIKQVNKSNFYKQAVEYKILDPSKPFPINLETKVKEKSIFSKISSHLEEKTLMDLLGQEIGLALYPSDKPGTNNYLFAAKISAITKIQEKLQRAKDSLIGKQATVSKSNYKEKTIISYENQEQKYSFHYVITKNHILGASSDALLKKGIDLMDGKGSDRFIHSEGFKSLFKASDLSRAGLLFMDMEKIFPTISSNVMSADKTPTKAAADINKDLQSFKYLGLTFNIQKGLKIEGVLTINKEKAGRELLQTINMEPRKLKSLNFMPENVVIYGANIFEPSLFFEQFTKGFGKKAAKKTPGEFFGESTGVDLEKDIIPSIGNEFFFSVSAQDKTAPLQVPDITMGLEIKDREKIKNIFNKIRANLAKSSKQKSIPGESYEGYDVNFLPISAPIPIQPTYSIVNNFLLFSVSQAGIRRAIDTLKGKIPPLDKSKKYISANIPVKNNGMFFINASLLWDSLSEVITKAPAGLSLTSSEQSVEKRMKFLDLMRAVQSFNSVFMYKKNQINSRTFIALKDIPKIRKNKELLAFLEKSRQKAVPPLTPAKSLQAQQVSYDYVYNPEGKRDPFQSLIAGRQLTKKKLVQFFESIKGLEPINLHLYNKIKRKDPVLYKKLKSNSSFFKNKKTMKQISDEEKIQKLEEYKQLISIAKTDFHDTILGPLQSSQYSSLKLTGIIWGQMGSTALIETPDGRGYSVKVNDLIGPNYGVIKKIEKDKIVVVERYISYIGKITEERQEIKLSKGEGSI